MAKNRLNLNFQLESAADRAEFVRNYLSGVPFVPTADELETIGNYILWGKNEKGLNAQQEGQVKIKEWAPEKVESLEGLLEAPGFNERSLKTLSAPALRTPRVVFDRAEAMADAPEWMRPYYEDLFRQIDELELVINYYDLWTGKRKLPPRASLLNRFSAAEQQALNERALKLSQYRYLKMKHMLVDLRNEQYTYRDTYCARVLSHAQPEEVVQATDSLRLDEDVQVLPLGLINSQSLLSLKLFAEPEPGQFSDEELREVSEILWGAEQIGAKFVLDFRNPAHVLSLYCAREDLRDGALEDPKQIYGSAASVIATLQYYEQHAALTELQKEILELKLAHKQNYEIAGLVNTKYGKSYNENYISTIYHQKIIASVAAAAEEHYEIVSNLFFPENFKTCKDCGRVLLLNSNNFVKQKKSADGFSPRCKACEKKKRSKYK